MVVNASYNRDLLRNANRCSSYYYASIYLRRSPRKLALAGGHKHAPAQGRAGGRSAQRR